MNDPRRPQRFGPPLSGYGPTGPQVPPNPPTADPAYADQSPYASTYGGYVSPPWSPGGPPPRPPQWPPGPHEASPTQQLPQYWQYDQPPPGGFPPRRADSPATARAENAALVVVRRRLSRAARRRVGHRTGYRQRLGQKSKPRSSRYPPCPGLARHVRPRPHRPHPHPAPHRHRQLRPVRPVRRSPARCKPLSTTSRGKAGQSASRTWIAATSYRPSSTSPCRGGKRSACQSRPCIPLASRSSTSATTSPARSPWPGFRYASAPGRG